MADRYTERGREIGTRIAEARKELGGMRQEELADLIGVSPRSVQAYEAGEVIPYRYLRSLEEALGRPAAWFLHGEEAVQVKDEQFEQILKELRALTKKVESLEKRLQAPPSPPDAS